MVDRFGSRRFSSKNRKNLLSGFGGRKREAATILRYNAFGGAHSGIMSNGTAGGGRANGANTSFGKWFEQRQTQRSGEGATTAMANTFESESTPLEKAQNAWKQTSSRVSSFFDQWTRGETDIENGGHNTNGDTAAGPVDAEANTQEGGESDTLLQRMWSNVGQSQEEGDNCGLSRTQRFQLFLLLFSGSMVLFCLAIFLFLPVLIIVPSKFALSCSLGSILFMSSFAVLNGPRRTVRGLFTADRAWFSASYIGSLMLTLYASIIMNSLIFTILGLAVQVSVLLWYAASSIPGGRRGLQFMQNMCVRSGRAIGRMIMS
eukprot:gb/GECG01011028.1/.p1 GENE.gb/GECG01011028.1/~~gb/GECG01011028.1/.p1  ORF type:complete len:318 (+),score=43.07 gb/GECG01011028.1/:1-954(+)